MNRSKLFHYFKLLISVVLFGAVIYFVIRDGQSLSLIKNFSVLPAVLLLVVHAANYYFLGNAYNFPLAKHGVTLTFSEWYGLTVVTNLLNLILPAKTGNSIRLLYLNEKKRLSFHDFAQLNIAVAALALSTLSGFGVCYFVLFSKSALLNKAILTGILSVIFLLTTTYLVFPSFINRFLPKSIPAQPRLYFSTRKEFFTIAGNLLLVKALYPLKLYLAFQVLQYPISILDTYEISLVVLLISLVPILPGNIGIKEFSTAFMAQSFNINLEVAMLVAVVERLSYFTFLIPTGTYFYATLFGKDLLSFQKLGKNSRISSDAP
ncbi:lysylphosphatidylglycerol synthase transmembrane domain-containing protein [Bdellovibrio sp. HCB337]|uniref:lysylphosphatidylglycerol synthase transmembrane domain-containing protein n=1 Tax=Bdellovibrio sp. HCB337 TaxID=3394358 RepID=UPI0039A64286